jgi:hypothetical protein
MEEEGTMSMRKAKPGPVSGIARPPLLALVVALISTSLVTSLPANALSLGPPNSQRKVLAQAEAKKLFSLAPLPPGSQPRTTLPPSNGNPYLVGITQTAYVDEVNLTAYTVAPQETDAYNWLLSRSPPGGHLTGYGGSGGLAASSDMSSVDFAFKGTSVLPGPELEYNIGTTPSGDVEIRMDVTVQWIPQKSLNAVMAAGAVKVVVIVNRGETVKSHPITRAATVTQTMVGQILAKVNALEPPTPTIPSSAPVVCNCSIVSSSSMTLRFFKAGANRPYAKAVAHSGGDVVIVRQYNRSGALAGTGMVAGGYNLTTWVAKKLGIEHPTVTSLP